MVGENRGASTTIEFDVARLLDYRRSLSGRMWTCTVNAGIGTLRRRDRIIITVRHAEKADDCYCRLFRPGWRTFQRFPIKIRRVCLVAR